MEYDYYLHKSEGPIRDYFGYVGIPFKVSFIRYCLYKWLGYRATRVPKDSSLRRVLIRAELKSGTHRNSIKMKELLNDTK